jgi:hypothetical protein
MEAPEPVASEDAIIEVRVPGSQEFLEILRSVVWRATRMAGFSFDGVEDFALAVDEAAVLLLSSEPTDLHLTTSPVMAGVDRIGVLISVTAPQGLWPPPELRSDTRWQVLEAICEEVWILDDGRVGIGLAQSVR